MNNQMLLVVVTFLTATTLAIGANVPNSNVQNNAPPQLGAANGPSPLELLGQPGPGPVGQPGDTDDLDKAEFFYGGWGGLGLGFGSYYGGGWGGRNYYGYGGYPHGGGGYYGRYRYPYYGWY